MEFTFENWLGQGAIIGKVGKWVELHWGPVQTFKKESELSQPAFYKNNFSLREKKNWFSYAYSKRMEWKPWRELVLKNTKSLSLPVPKKIKWEEPDKKNFEKVFKSIKKEIQDKNIVKAVPVVSSRAEKVLPPQVPVFSVLKQAPKNTYVYGQWADDTGFLGFTPEILFLSEKEKKIKTMALAGTRRRDIVEQDPENFLHNPKEQKEHQIVVQDILGQLQKIGKAKHSKTGLLELDYLVHLYTPMEVTTAETPTFESLVELLHPTPALGISPRDKFDLLKAWRDGSDFLGSPFGIRWSAHQFIGLVAIRNLRWDQNFYYIDNGCGLVAESQLEDEWKELKLKRESVRKVFKI